MSRLLAAATREREIYYTPDNVYRILSKTSLPLRVQTAKRTIRNTRTAEKHSNKLRPSSQYNFITRRLVFRFILVFGRAYLYGIKLILNIHDRRFLYSLINYKRSTRSNDYLSICLSIYLYIYI